MNKNDADFIPKNQYDIAYTRYDYATLRYNTED